MALQVCNRANTTNKCHETANAFAVDAIDKLITTTCDDITDGLLVHRPSLQPSMCPLLWIACQEDTHRGLQLVTDGDIAAFDLYVRTPLGTVDWSVR